MGHAAMKADDDGKLSQDQHAARQKENKKLQISKKKKKVLANLSAGLSGRRITEL